MVFYSSAKGGAIAGIVVGVLFLLVIVGAIICCCKNRSRSRSPPRADVPVGYYPNKPAGKLQLNQIVCFFKYLELCTRLNLILPREHNSKHCLVNTNVSFSNYILPTMEILSVMIKTVERSNILLVFVKNRNWKYEIKLIFWLILFCSYTSI